MSISFVRNGKLVELQEFSNHEVIEYLAKKLNIDKTRFKLVAKPKFCNGVMAKIDDANFIIHANKTWIELSFDQADSEKLSTVIEEITKWDKFSKTEKTFYVEINENGSRTIIFENGYATCGEYRLHFGDDKLRITSFKNN
jgi:hypothetical protein